MEKVFCQSCGMPMEDKSLFGTNQDGTLNNEYCKYCYEEGKFTQETDLKGMIETCIPFMVQDGMKEEEARKLLEENLPKLKRWKSQ